MFKYNASLVHAGISHLKQPEGNAGLLTDTAVVLDQPNAAAPASQSFSVSATWYPLEQVEVPFAAKVKGLVTSLETLPMRSDPADASGVSIKSSAA